jgi:hypothetical protein
MMAAKLAASWVA